ncbi:ABC transporter substrate-binding protein [Acidithiobacillus ferrianus]|uniref:ABC transporter substrate-binding protein n=1 Tax=Acidithiobacillus ferrianus TaxID=2678518 RepID=UPI0034E4911C
MKKIINLVIKMNNNKRLMIMINVIIFLMVFLHTVEARAETHPVQILSTVLGVGSGQTPALDGFDPLISTTEASENLESLYIYPLLYVNRNMQIDYSKSIASSISVNKKQTLYIIKLKKNFEWSNGKMVTADNVLNCFDEIKDLGALFPNQGLAGIPQNIAYLKINNIHELTIKLKRRINPELFEFDGLTMLNPIYSKPASKKILEKNSSRINAFKVSDGPYKLVSYYPGRYVDLEKNNNFSLKNELNGPNFLRLSLNYNNLSQVMGLFADKLQVVEPLASFKSAIKDDSNVGVFVNKKGFMGFNFIAINYNNNSMNAFKDWKIRHELSQAINQKEIIKSAYHGYGYQMHGVISEAQLPVINYYSKKGNEENKHIILNRDDGMKLKSGRNMNGESITLLCSDNLAEKSTAEIIKNNWSRIGIKVKIMVLPSNLLIEKLRTNSWQMAIVSFATNNIPIMSMLLGKGGRFNFSGYKDPKINLLFKKIRLSDDGQELSKRMYEMNNFIIKEQPFIILPHQKIIIAYQRKIKGVRDAFTPQGGFWPQYIH